MLPKPDKDTTIKGNCGPISFMNIDAKTPTESHRLLKGLYSRTRKGLSWECKGGSAQRLRTAAERSRQATLTPWRKVGTTRHRGERGHRIIWNDAEATLDKIQHSNGKNSQRTRDRREIRNRTKAIHENPQLTSPSVDERLRASPWDQEQGAHFRHCYATLCWKVKPEQFANNRNKRFFKSKTTSIHWWHAITLRKSLTVNKEMIKNNKQVTQNDRVQDQHRKIVFVR